MTNVRKWKGLQSLVQVAIDQGSVAIERVQKEASNRPFAILESIPPLARPAALVHAIYDGSISAVHGAIRGVNHAVGATFHIVFEACEKESR